MAITTDHCISLSIAARNLGGVRRSPRSSRYPTPGSRSAPMLARIGSQARSHPARRLSACSWQCRWAPRPEPSATCRRALGTGLARHRLAEEFGKLGERVDDPERVGAGAEHRESRVDDLAVGDRLEGVHQGASVRRSGESWVSSPSHSQMLGHSSSRRRSARRS